MTAPRRIGIEEEFLLVDLDTGRPAARIDDVIGDAVRLAGDAAETELHRAQIEVATPVCDRLDEAFGHLVGLRDATAEAAARHNARVVASATYPSAMGREGQLITDKARYRAMAGANAHLAREQLICGCHIHVSVDSPDDAVKAAGGTRRWLPLLLALSANSPFWEGADTGFDSYRTEVWSRWPTAGPPGDFAGPDDYWGMLDALIGAGIILDRAMAYWDVRPSARYPTVELRVADVMADPEEAVVMAGLARALVTHCLSDDRPSPSLRHELLRAASWKAARSGLSGSLMDPLDGSVGPAAVAITQLVDMLADILDEFGDRERVAAGVSRILAEGNGATRQRAAFAGSGSIDDVLAVTDVAGRPAR